LAALDALPWEDALAVLREVAIAQQLSAEALAARAGESEGAEPIQRALFAEGARRELLARLSPAEVGRALGDARTDPEERLVLAAALLEAGGFEGGMPLDERDAAALARLLGDEAAALLPAPGATSEERSAALVAVERRLGLLAALPGSLAEGPLLDLLGSESFPAEFADSAALMAAREPSAELLERTLERLERAPREGAARQHLARLYLGVREGRTAPPAWDARLVRCLEETICAAGDASVQHGALDLLVEAAPLPGAREALRRIAAAPCGPAGPALQERAQRTLDAAGE
jgi:hypothetical protein